MSILTTSTQFSTTERWHRKTTEGLRSYGNVQERATERPRSKELRDGSDKDTTGGPREG